MLRCNSGAVSYTHLEFGKVQAGTAYGVTPKAYVDLKAALPRYDSDGNGSFNQAEVAAAINSLGGLGGGLSNCLLYTSGEIEARDVTERRRMTPEQRRETIPNTGDENTIFVDSLGTEYSAEAAEPVDSQAFKDWFGDWTSDRANHSQVVDDQGRPLIVYHGTGTSIEEFVPEFTGQGNDQYGLSLIHI